MDNEIFGSIIYNGNTINLDKEKIENLKEISGKLKQNYANLSQKLDKFFQKNS